MLQKFLLFAIEIYYYIHLSMHPCIHLSIIYTSYPLRVTGSWNQPQLTSGWRRIPCASGSIARARVKQPFTLTVIHGSLE